MMRPDFDPRDAFIHDQWYCDNCGSCNIIGDPCKVCDVETDWEEYEEYLDEVN